MNKILVAALVSASLAGCSVSIKTTEYIPKPVHENAPKNVIFMIGDGMGPVYTTGYRYYSDDPTTKEIETTVFDSMLVGMAQTYPDDKTVVTDSASSATALASGVKSYNGAIGVDVNKQPVKTMLVHAKEKGMQTALVATSSLTHATPASFVAHNESRHNAVEIAHDFVDNKVNGQLPVDLMLGGGTKFFQHPDRDVLQELIDAGYQHISEFTDQSQLTQLPAVGMFAPDGLPHALDSSEPLRLHKMTQTALRLLDPEKGFFMMIEGSQIDWCGHKNDITCAMGEMEDFAKAVEVVKDYVDQRDDTVLVITADHSTGGLTLAQGGDYKWETEELNSISSSGEALARSMFCEEDVAATWSKHGGLALSDEELATLSDTKNKEKLSATSLMVRELLNAHSKKDAPSGLAAQLYCSDDAAQTWSELVSSELSAEELSKLQSSMGRENRNGLTKAVKGMIDKRSYTGWTTSGHTAHDVQIFAYGTGAEAFRGNLNNTDIGKRLIEFIQQ